MLAIQICHVSKRYGAHAVLKDFSLTIKARERLVIVGPSGCGKTTLLRLIAGLTVPDEGQIVLGRDLVARAGRNITGPEQRGVGMVFQDLALWPHMSVKANIEFGLRAQWVSKDSRERRVREVLELVRMERHALRRPAELSGGEQQRLALARALALMPKILLMDEPLSNLDAALNLQLRKEIVRLQEQFGFTLVYVTHNREEVVDMGHRVVSMKEGKIVGETIP